MVDRCCGRAAKKVCVMGFLKKALAACAAMSVLGLCSVAHAVQVWSWAYSGAGVDAAGFLTTAGPALAPEDILSFSGTRNGEAIVGLVPLGADSDFIYDNQFQAAAPQLSFGGVLFALAGGVHVNVYFDAGTFLEATSITVPPDLPIQFSAQAVPELPTSLTMMVGLGLFAGMAARRPRQAMRAV
jgi:hypothetical protein